MEQNAQWYDFRSANVTKNDLSDTLKLLRELSSAGADLQSLLTVLVKHRLLSAHGIDVHSNHPKFQYSAFRAGFCSNVWLQFKTNPTAIRQAMNSDVAFNCSV